MSTPVTLKLSVRLKMRVARAAKRKGQTSARWMLEAIHHEVERRERFEVYVRQARRANPTDSDVSSRGPANSWLEGFSSAARARSASSRRVL